MLTPREKKSFPLTSKLSFPMGKFLAQRGAAAKLLDNLGASVWAAWGFRLLRTAYAGPLLHVRRTSDNAVLDVGYTSSGDLDEAALSAFAGANSVVIDIIYDQSGNARNLVQVPADAQPRIINAGAYDRINSRACFYTDGADDFLATAVASVAQPVTIASVVEMIDLTQYSFLYDAPPTAATRIGSYFTTANNLGVFSPTDAAVKNGVVANEKATIVTVFNGASSSVDYNGASSAINPGTDAFGGIKFGAHQDNFFWSEHKFGDQIVFNAALSAGQIATVKADFKAYWGTP